MVIVTGSAPRTILAQTLLETARKHRPTGNERAMILLPAPKRRTFSGRFSLIGGMEYNWYTMSFVLMPHLITRAIDVFSAIPATVRIPYIVFVCSDEFYRLHHSELHRWHASSFIASLAPR